MAETDDFVLRRSDFSLDAEQEAVREAFHTFFEKECSSERVRASETTGWDPELWKQLIELRPVAMSVPIAAGGDGGGLVELVLLCEEVGRCAAPIPIIDTVVVARALAAAGVDIADGVVERLLDGEIGAVALSPADAVGRHLTGWGAAAATVLACGNAGVILVDAPLPGELVPNLASSPMAWRSIEGGALVGGPAAAADVQREWRLLVAAALVGLGDAALTLAVDYARERVAFGVPIGTFQAIAHPLVDVAIGIESARRLVRKAAWFSDHQPEAGAARVAMAYIHAADAAEQAGYVAIHTQGGFGFTSESDVQLFYRRAKGWPLLAGDRRREYQRLADALYGQAGAGGGAA